jgi:hypothetical protein
VESIKLENARRFEGAPVEISILDQAGGDKAPSVMKTIKNVKLCPDGTHIRFYFDDVYFLAVPLTSDVSESESHWSAADGENGLMYIIKKAQVQ